MCGINRRVYTAAAARAGSCNSLKANAGQAPAPQSGELLPGPLLRALWAVNPYSLVFSDHAPVRHPCRCALAGHPCPADQKNHRSLRRPTGALIVTRSLFHPIFLYALHSCAVPILKRGRALWFYAPAGRRFE